MRAFKFDEKLIEDYAAFSRSFTTVRASDLQDEIDRHYDDGHFWPEPLLSINPSFEQGASSGDLAQQGVIAEETAQVFRIENNPIQFYAHQAEAIAKAKSGKSFVVTTGTGSGKSLCFFVPILDQAIRSRLTGEAARTRAIIVYPMNALANSQIKEVQKFVDQSGLPDNLKPTVARYTGQESDTERRQVAANPPDILLTNFMMLELLMTRQDDLDRKVIENARGLEFIVLDELHTYRGRQGADVAVLVRRLRDRCKDGKPPICIGTSATMASEDSSIDPEKAVARVASRLFGTDVGPDAIIGESLTRATDPGLSLDDVKPLLIKIISDPLGGNLTNADLKKHPLAVWTELELGIDEAKSRSRRKPRALKDAVEQLAKNAGGDVSAAEARLTEFLALAALPENKRGGTSKAAFMAFKLHRFISGAGDVLTTMRSKPRRVLLEGQRNDPKDKDARLYPTRFCRECGQEYHVVILTDDGQGTIALPRDIDDTPPKEPRDGQEPGYLSPYEQASDTFKFSGDISSYPEDWLEEKKGVETLRSNRKKQMPRLIDVRENGRVSEGGEPFWFIPGRFGFCLACGDHPSPQARERNKLASLTAEGRSSATTTIVTSMLKSLNAPDSGIDEPHKRKTLGFTDNRQDAALQAGHFNDSIFVTLLRGALLRAVIDSGAEGLGDDEFGPRVQKALGYGVENEALRRYWMADPTVLGANRIEAGRTLARVLAHRVWADLRRGWRYTYPNLLGLDLIRPTFVGLDELVDSDEFFADAPLVLRELPREDRPRVIEMVLNAMLEGLAIASDALDPLLTDGLKDRSRALLAPPWSVDAREDLRAQSALVLDAPPRKGQKKRDDMLLLRAGSRSGLARQINRPSVLGSRLKTPEYNEALHWLLGVLVRFGILREINTASDIAGWQILPSAMRLVAGPSVDDPSHAANAFFHGLYFDVAKELVMGKSALMGVEAREHTAQVTSQQRMWRECRFRYEDDDQNTLKLERSDIVSAGEGTGFLPALFCSPTMELGVDISSLNAVYLRNVPPTPANYAQRAGRAGRSGQAAVIATYCAAQSPHDQYFFRKRIDMVAGSVRPPALDLANEELVRSHLHAVWLSESHQPLSRDIPEVLDLNAEGFPVRTDITTALSDPELAPKAIPLMRSIVDAILSYFDGPIPEWLEEPDAYVERVAAEAFSEFQKSFNRWRDLYNSARSQMEITQKKLLQTGLSMRDRRALEGQERAASQQVGILENGGSDFYTYRYLATEGFLPGYNFPRLPLYAFIPPGGTGRQAAFLQRARFLAISEFGPRSLIYHEGRAYRVHKANLPPGSVSADGKSLATGQIFICASCGASHDEERERCHACNAPLAGCLPIKKTLRIDNVETLPTERITANDEERVRQGFEIQTVFSWPHRDGKLDVTEVKLRSGGEHFATLQYANGADIQRLNLGLKRRAEKTIMGFGIDPSTGRWAAMEDESTEDTPPDQAKPERIVPIVQDRKNALLIRFTNPDAWSQSALTTFQHALLRGIEVVFQLEEGEILGEPLPSREERRTILLYEATEGGAGVLSRIIRDTGLLRTIVEESLSLMHYDGAKEAIASQDTEILKEHDDAHCVKGCYRCLLSYYNQPDQEAIDRTEGQALGLLLTLAACVPDQSGNTNAGDVWASTFLAQGIAPPDTKPLVIDGTTIPYAWQSDYVAATSNILPPEVINAAEKRGWEIIQLPESPSEGIPERLKELLGNRE